MPVVNAVCLRCLTVGSVCLWCAGTRTSFCACISTAALSSGSASKGAFPCACPGLTGCALCCLQASGVVPSARSAHGEANLRQVRCVACASSRGPIVVNSGQFVRDRSLDPRLAISYSHVGRIFKDLGRYECVVHSWLAHRSSTSIFTPLCVPRSLKNSASSLQSALDIEIDAAGENAPIVAQRMGE